MIKKIKLSDEAVFGGTRITTSIEKNTIRKKDEATGEWKDLGTNGIKVAVLSPSDFSPCTVVIEGMSLEQFPLSTEEITARNTARQYVYVVFEGFEGELKQRFTTKENYIVGKALSVKLEDAKKQ